MLQIKQSHPVFIQEFFWAQNRTLATVPQMEQHVHDPDIKVAQLDTKRCLKKKNTSNFSAGSRQRSPTPAPVSWIDFWTRKKLERRRASQNPEQPARVLMERRPNETLTLSAGHINDLKVWTVSQARRLQLLKLTLARVDDGGCCGWLRPLQTSASHTEQSTRSRQRLTKWKHYVKKAINLNK